MSNRPEDPLQITEKMGLWTKATIHQNTPEDPLQIIEKMGLWDQSNKKNFSRTRPITIRSIKFKHCLGEHASSFFTGLKGFF